MSKTKVITFDTPKHWVINKKEVEIKRIETTTYTWTAKVLPSKIAETVEPNKALYSIVRNSALMPNASFHYVDAHRVLVRIADYSAGILINTEWYIPLDRFNSLVTTLIVQEGIPEEKFYVHSKYEQ